MMALLLQAIVFVAAVIIVARAEPALNRMTPRTSLPVRIAIHMLAVGALAEIVFVLGGEVPTWPTAITMIGIAALLVCERRLRVLCSPPLRGRAP